MVSAIAGYAVDFDRHRMDFALAGVQKALALPPSFRIISTVSSAESSRMSAATTLAPSRANSTAAARPIPSPAPTPRRSRI